MDNCPQSTCFGNFKASASKSEERSSQLQLLYLELALKIVTHRDFSLIFSNTEVNASEFEEDTKGTFLVQLTILES